MPHARKHRKPNAPPSEPHVIVTWDDAGGMPRAYAFGPESKLDAVKERAREHLAAYIRERQAVGEAVTARDFTEKIHPVERVD